MRKTLLASALAVALVAACGGGDDDTPPPAPTAQVPTSASASPSGFISYLIQLVASAADTLEPVDTSTVVGPTDDTSEPTKVD